MTDWVGISVLVGTVTTSIISLIGAVKAQMVSRKVDQTNEHVEAVRGDVTTQLQAADAKRDEARVAVAAAAEIAVKNADLVVDIAKTTDAIKHGVNSQASASQERIDSLQRELQLAKELLANSQHQTSMLTQTLATTVAAGTQTVVLPPASAAPAEPVAHDRRKEDHPVA